MKLYLFVLFSLILSWTSFAEEPVKKRKTLRMVTHEVSPLMDSKLPGGGALVDSLRIVLDKMGYDLEVVFVSSWARAKIIAKNDKTIHGYFPYATREHEKIFDFSEFFLEDPWVIAERKENPVVWKKAEDLAKYTGGNVTGVELRPGIKELFDAGKLKIETTSSNFYNLQKLINKRVDYVFIDLFIFHNEMNNNPALKIHKDKLQVNIKPVVVNRYGIAVRKDNVSKDFLPEFNKISGETTKYIVAYADRMKKMMEKSNGVSK